MDRRAGAARSEDPDAAQLLPRATRNAARGGSPGV